MAALRTALLLLCTSAFAAGQTTLQIAAAADLSPVLKELIPAFERANGAKVEAILGSSGNLFAQIQNGAPFDVFLSADDIYPQRLSTAGQAEHLMTYAEGSIVLWVRNDSKLNLAKGLDVLLDSSVKKIAIANPAHAPYGRAAMSALEHLQLSDKLRNKLVLGENISQATQFVQTGNSDVGIIALSLALSPELKNKGRYWQIPQDAYPRMKQVGAVISNSKRKQTAEAFLTYLKTAAAQQILKKFGFRPTGDVAS